METKSITLIDPFDSDKRVNAEESTDNPWKHWLVVLNPDWSNIFTEYVSWNIDTADWTYYYFMSFLPWTEKWRINRLNKSTYVSDYATWDSDLQDAWDDRATHTYLISY